jgi:hypothetical protein
VQRLLGDDGLRATGVDLHSGRRRGESTREHQ